MLSPKNLVEQLLKNKRDSLQTIVRIKQNLKIYSINSKEDKKEGKLTKKKMGQRKNKQ